MSMRRTIDFNAAMRDLRRERVTLTPEQRKAWIDREVEKALARAGKKGSRHG
jgi:hypothetical protein